jgi:gluconolactonase
MRRERKPTEVLSGHARCVRDERSVRCRVGAKSKKPNYNLFVDGRLVMKHGVDDPESSSRISRRGLVKRLGAAAAVVATAPHLAMAQSGQATAPSTISNPPRDFGPNAAPTPYPDADVLSVDPLFDRYRLPNTPILRLWTGAIWAEGPAWSSQGQYLVWSDIPNNRQLRWLHEDGHVSVFRMPSYNSNGNSFDFQGRQLTCEHMTRRVVRYEHDGSVTVIADSYNGKHLNSPNDLVPHPDGSVWFTDPPFGESLYEGVPDAPGGPGNQAGHLKSHVGQPADSGNLKRELPAGVYRADPSGKVELLVGEDQLQGPNGIAFSPDYKKVYIVTLGGGLDVFDVSSDNRLTNKKVFSDFMIDGVKCATDGLRIDVDGNLWCASNAGAHVGYSGVTIWSPDGKLIGRIRLPESCANVTFGGPKRNRLFMIASTSVYAVYVNTQGVSPG